MRLNFPVVLVAVALAGCAGAAPEPQGPAPDANVPDAGEGRLLRVGVPVTASLTESDPTWGTRGRFHLYRFEASAGERLAIELSSDDFDAFLVVGDRSAGIFNPTEQDDDSGGELDARIRFVVPRDGTYWVIAQALSDYSTGAYTLALSRLPAPRPAVAVPLAVGASALGELSEDDAMQEDDESFYDLYTFQAADGQRYAVSMSSPSFDTYLHLGSGTAADFQEIVSNDDGGDGTDSRIVFTPERTGTYTVQATSYAAGATGEYSISIAQLPPPRPLTIVPLQFGETVTGSLDEGDPMADDGSFFDSYGFRGAQGQRVSITQRSADFDSYLELGTMSGGEFVGEYGDDDSAGELDSRIVVTLPETGDYVVRANSLFPEGTGAYSLVLEELPPPGPATVRPIRIGQTLDGSLDPDDAVLDDESHFDIYTFRGQAGQRVRIILRSDDFDAFLAFGSWRDGDVSVTDTDDDGAGGLDSQLVVTLPATGEYAIRANSLGSGEFGAYTVTLEEAI